jgi:hypothetical protein
VLQAATQATSYALLDKMEFAKDFYQFYFTTVYVLLSISILVLLISVFFVGMVVFTESRKWKNVSHISWVNGLLVLALS